MLGTLTRLRFRWVACQIDALKDCLDYPRLQKALNTLPKTLDETYSRILDRIPREHSVQAATILNLLIWSDYRFTIEELVDAIATDLDEDPAFDPKNRMPVPRDVLKLCSGLVAVFQVKGLRPGKQRVQLAHFSVKEYLVSNHVSGAFKSLNSETVANSHLAKLCLGYLIGVSQLTSLKPYEKEVRGEFPFWLKHSLEIDKEFPFANYSANYWMDHARDVENGDESLCEMASNFFLEEREAFSLFKSILRPEAHMPPDANPLFYAARCGSKRIAENLLDRSADVSADSAETLYMAMSCGHDMVAQLLLDRGVFVITEYHWVFQVAMRHCHDTTIQSLLDRCADRDTAYREALIIASSNGRDTTVQLLLDRGADVNAVGDEALHEALIGGHDTTVQLLLNSGADVNAGDGEALDAAASCGRDTTVQILLDRGADVNAGDGMALRMASQRGDDLIVQLLLNSGAEINAGGGQALHEASTYGRDTTIQLLLDYGADVNAGGGQALHGASTYGRDTTIQLLLDYGADVNAGDGQALRVASRGGYDLTVQLLIERGADVNAHWGPTSTALHEVMSSCYRKLVEELREGFSRAAALELADVQRFFKIARSLVDNGAEINNPGGKWLNTLRTDGWSVHVVQQILERNAFLSIDHLLSAMLDTDPQAEAIVSVMLPYITPEIAATTENYFPRWNLLHHAAIFGSEIVTRRCLDLKAEVDARDYKERTALHFAASYGHLSVVKMLVSAGASIEAADMDGWTPLVSTQIPYEIYALPKGRKRRADPEVIQYLSQLSQEGSVESSATQTDTKKRKRSLDDTGDNDNKRLADVKQESPESSLSPQQEPKKSHRRYHIS
jgi:ankyrin repeat protein